MKQRVKIHPAGRQVASWFMGIAFVVPLCGCGATSILSSNLSCYNDGVSLEELSGIPCPPEEDFTDNVIPQVFVTSGGTNLLNGNKLQITGGRVDYRTAGHSVPDRYLVAWRGLKPVHSSGQTNIRLQDANGRNAVVLRFEGERLTVRTGNGAQNPEPSFSEIRAHEARIVIDVSGLKSVSVVVSELGEEIFDGQGLELLDADFSSLHTVQIESESGVDYFMQRLNASVLNED